MVYKAPIIIRVNFGMIDGGPNEGKLLIDVLLEDDRFRNIFEVGFGRGSTALPSREKWEEKMFGLSFKGKTGERPKYGTINLTGDPLGVMQARPYGRSYFVLKDDARWRCTMT